MDPEILLEALSILVGATVKPLTQLKPGQKAEVLTLDNYLQIVFNYAAAITEGLDLWSPLQSLLQLILRLNLQTSTDKVSSETSEETLSDTQEKTSGSATLLREVFVDMNTFFDPGYDYDFRNLQDDSACSRGGEEYRRPCGYYRYALKVKDKYPGGNTWLGSGGWRAESSPGEWPVSFHGTSIDGAKGITSSHYKAGGGAVYGRGIYSTPDITVAEGYTMHKTFTSKKTGKTYRAIMQNRINPAERTIICRKDYWLIQVPEGTTPEEEKKIVERSIRPYGILVKEV